ncbi:MAG: hypothetical protein LBI03_08085, partial [Clostridiales bacterium]|nr:hypothetical protein [Clostridiales bacterium]
MNKILKKLVLDMNFRKWPNWQKLISLVLVTVMTAAIIVIPKIEKTMAAPVNPLPWSLQNGGFESGSGAFTNIVYYTNPSIPGKSPSYAQVPQDAVNYWSSSDPGTPPTVPPQAIEIWGNGFNACGSFYTHDQDPTAPTGATSSDIPNNTNTNNNHFAEISATINTSAIYQDIRVVPGEHLNWSLWHRGRFNSGPYHNIAGWDVMQVLIGPSPAGFTVTDGKYDAWKSMSTTQPQKDKFGGGLSFAGIEEDENNDKQQNFTAIVPDGSGFGTDNSLYYIADWTNAGYSSVPPGLVTNTVSNWEYHEG